MSLGDICSNCLDVVMYCECWIPKDKDFSESGDFTMGDGQRTVLWNSKTLGLEGDQELIAKIRSELSGEEVTICDVGTIWMDEREPVAVTFIGSGIGLGYGPDAPKYGMLNNVPCPTCGSMIEHFERYPNYICGNCVAKLVDVNGVPIRFENQSLLGTGIIALLLNPATGDYDLPDQISSMTGEAFCNGLRCVAEEARFGGVIVQAMVDK